MVLWRPARQSFRRSPLRAERPDGELHEPALVVAALRTPAGSGVRAADVLHVQRLFGNRAMATLMTVQRHHPQADELPDDEGALVVQREWQTGNTWSGEDAQQEATRTAAAYDRVVKQGVKAKGPVLRRTAKLYKRQVLTFAPLTPTPGPQTNPATGEMKFFTGRTYPPGGGGRILQLSFGVGGCAIGAGEIALRGHKWPADATRPTEFFSDASSQKVLIHEASHSLVASYGDFGQGGSGIVIRPDLDRYKDEFRAYWLQEERPDESPADRAARIRQHILAHYEYAATAYAENAGFKAAVDNYVMPEGYNLVQSRKLHELYVSLTQTSTIKKAKSLIKKMSTDEKADLRQSPRFQALLNQMVDDDADTLRRLVGGM